MPPPSPNREFGYVFVDELARHGVTDAVVAPGSRSTPIALAFAADSRIRVHVRIDERSASFLALGLARGSGRPVPVLCTSGTAAAHFHAATLEADHACVPLLLLTADRPPELRGTGANQTIDQLGLYGSAVRWWCDVGVPEDRPESMPYWRSIVSQAVAVSLGRLGGPAGPVQLNLPMREPLVPVGVGYSYPLDGRAGGRPWTAVPPAVMATPAGLPPAERGVIVAGDGLSLADADAVVAFAEARGWPLIAEPHSNARRGRCALRAVDALLRSEEFVAAHRPDLVVVAGRLTVSRAVQAWIATMPRVVVVDPHGRWADPNRRADAVVAALPSASDPPADASWWQSWVAASTSASEALDAVLDADPSSLSEPQVVRDIAAMVPDGGALVVASSMPIRDLDLTMRPRTGLRVIANRGVSGIDGFVSTAVGVALSHETGPVVAIAGDLSFLHDVNGLIGSQDVDLTIVVLNNDGGGIFSLLPQASAVPMETFERLFGTPHGVDLAAVCAAYGVRHEVAHSRDAVVATGGGRRVVEVRTDRVQNAALHRRIAAL